MSNQSDRVKRWRHNCKDRIITAMGGSCCICGYKKCQSALALHHLDPNQKDFGFGTVRANPKNWQVLVAELRKCILLCHVCHCEIHEGLISVPADVSRFDESFTDYKKLEQEEKEKITPLLTACPVCAKMKPSHLINCSLSCSGKAKRKIDWDSLDLKEILKEKTVVALAEELNCSDAAVHKRLKKLGLK